MLALGENRFLIQPEDPLPELRAKKFLFLDVETTSFNDKVEAFRPYAGHRICGVALTVDDDPRTWYLPVRHRSGGNVPVERWKPWLQDIVGSAPYWVNHNVKFDAHFLSVDDITYGGMIFDTVVLAKTINSDRFAYGLKELCRDWKIDPMEESKRLGAFLRESKSKDFAVAPPDMLGEYACRDVMANRQLYNYVCAHRPEDMDELWKLETMYTGVLFDMEHRGFLVDPQQLKVEKYRCLRRMVPAAEELTRIANGREFVNSPDWIHELLITENHLPILAWAEKGPSFDSDALQLYAGHPAVVTNPVLSRAVELIRAYRKDSTFMSLFVDSLMEKHIDGIVHPSYNQLIRTGRTSGSDPNTQQFDKRAKSLVHPRRGMSFLSADASQVEFRIIAHYCKDEDTIRAYREDADTDFHQWVADKCGIERGPAKTLNFSMAYGAGRKKVQSQLALNERIVAAVQAEIDQTHPDIQPNARLALLNDLCTARAEAIYETYHEQFPNIKPTMATAANLCRTRGYIRNAYNYRRHLPPNMSFKAFNSLVQGCAMHVIKERMNFLAPRFNEKMRELGGHILINVHDEILFELPTEVAEDPNARKWIEDSLCDVQKEFRVPFRWDIGWSAESWEKAVA